jgi:hypothetical protein
MRRYAPADVQRRRDVSLFAKKGEQFGPCNNVGKPRIVMRFWNERGAAFACVDHADAPPVPGEINRRREACRAAADN